MKFYKIYKHPSGKLEAVKVGWSWPAFFFNFIWALIKKLWLVAFALIILHIVLGGINLAVIPSIRDYPTIYAYELALDLFYKEHWLFNSFMWLMSIGMAAIMGLKGNMFREHKLINLNCQLVTSVHAANPDAAIYTALNKIGE